MIAVVMNLFCLQFRIERLWRDVWVSATQLFYEVLHSLEEDGLLDLSNVVHLFCAHHIFIPRLANTLHTFVEAWDNHPLRTEGGLTPNQLWVLGHMTDVEAEESEVCISRLLAVLLAASE